MNPKAAIRERRATDRTPAAAAPGDSTREPFANRLLAWWDRHGRKDLPWQEPRTAYRVWVSEIMLQQTQVATVIPYFERWMQRFPGVTALAAAPLDEVLAHWSGLGYYARARHLHRAARECVQRFRGNLPETANELAALPGIGPSTANAIVSLTQDRPAAVLDGNVRRLLARHALIEQWPGSAAAQQRLWREAERRLPRRRGANYTQAVMDLGALVCTRARPACPDCPVRADCQALAAGAVDRLPARKPATRVGHRTVYLLVLRDARGRVLLERRPPAGIWGGLWSLPEGAEPASLESALGIRIDDSEALPARDHRLSHLQLSIRPILARTHRAREVKCSAEQAWFALAERHRLGLPRPVAELLSEIESGEFG
jgi:A/G-specific adenine glycosylase